MGRLLTIIALVLGIFVAGADQRANAQSSLLEKGREKLSQLVFCVPPKAWSKKLQRCINPFVRKKTQRTRCKAPRVWSNRQGRCVFPVVEDERCGPGETFSASSNACICREGYERDGEVCVQLAQAEGPDYAEVQRCLNELGYNAGRVDGQPGQRTRRALRQFRRKVGLNNRPNRLDDDVTLQRLFKECRPEEVKTAEQEAPKAEVQAEPEPEPQPQPKPVKEVQSAKSDKTEAQASVLAAYPEVRCISKGLKKALSRVAGNVPVCGESCVPIPPGMSQAQLQQSEQEYAVNWCRNCVRVGKAGIICAK